MQSFSRRSRQQANDSRLKVVTWLVILVLIALSVAWWWQSTARRSAGEDALAATEMSSSSTAAHDSATPELDVAEPVQPAISEPAISEPAISEAATTETQAVVAPAASEAISTAPVLENASAAVATSVTTDASAAVSTEPAATESATAPQLKMGFTADCWLDVKDANGKTLFSGLKKANDELVLEGPEPLKFIIGAPMAVNLEYKGKSFDMSRYNNGRTARFSLPQE